MIQRKRCAKVSAVAFALVWAACLSAWGAPFTWDGGGADGKWNTPANWVGDVSPTAGNVDNLIFGATGAGTIDNDIGAFSAEPSVEFQASYTVTGSQIAWDHGDSLTVTGAGLTVELDAPTSFSNSVILNVASGSTLIFDGVVGGNTQATTHIGGGTIRYTNAGNTHSRSLIIGARNTSGRLEFSNAGALGSGSVDVTFGVWNNNSGNMFLAYVGSGDVSVAANLNYAGAAGNQSMTVVNDSPDNGDLTLTGTLAFGEGSVGETVYSAFTGSSTGTTTVSGAFQDHDRGGPTALTGIKLDSSGALRLTGANTYTGPTTVSNGTLLLNGSHTGGDTYSVASGATLGGTGSTDATVSLVSGSALAGGNADGLGTLTLSGAGGLPLSTGVNFRVAIDGTGANEHSAVAVTGGSVTLGSATLVIDDSGYATGDDTIIIVDNQTGSGVSGTFSGLAEGDTITNNNDWLISYIGGDGNDVTLTRVGRGTVIYLR